MKKSILALFASTFTVLYAAAQEKVEIAGQDVGSWFSQNWMWVTGVIVLLLVIIIAMSGRSKRKSTTLVKDQFGQVKSVTTTEERS